jgi:hypothetical protein
MIKQHVARPVPGLTNLLGHVLVDFERVPPAEREQQAELIENAFVDRILPTIRKWRRKSARKDRYAELERMFAPLTEDAR